jgi:hypothetical protein
MEYPDRQGTRAVAVELEHENEDVTSGKRRENNQELPVEMACNPNEVKDQSYDGSAFSKSECSTTVLAEVKMFVPFVKRMMMKMEDMKMRKKRRMEILITQENEETMNVRGIDQKMKLRLSPWLKLRVQKASNHRPAAKPGNPLLGLVFFTRKKRVRALVPSLQNKTWNLCKKENITHPKELQK